MFDRLKDDAHSWSPYPPGAARGLIVLAVAIVVVGLSFGLLSRVRGAEIDGRVQSAKERIGHLAYFDKSLSRSGTQSCAGCHNPDPDYGYSNGLKVAVGPPDSRRGVLGVANIPTLLFCLLREGHPTNSDGRTTGLRFCSVQAIADPLVFANANVTEAANRLSRRKEYQEPAQIAFGRKKMTAPELRDCLVAFLHTITWDDLPADRLARGEEAALPAGALRGWKVVQRDCIVCHRPENGWQDFEFHNAGLSGRARSAATGRERVSGRAADRYHWLTSTFYGVANTPPYGHDGSIKDLDTAVSYFGSGGQYVRDGIAKRAEGLDPQIASIRETREEMADVKDFLMFGFQGPGYPFKENPWRAPK